MNKIIILNFENGEVHIFDYDNKKYEDPSDFFIDINETYKDIHLRENNCQYMIVEDLTIEIH